MARTPILSPQEIDDIRRDPRFSAAVAQRVADPDWRSRATCLRHDPELFFPNTAEDPAPALAVCRTCPVTGSCLAAAFDAGECEGVWGATTADERRRMRLVWVQTVATPV